MGTRAGATKLIGIGLLVPVVVGVILVSIVGVRTLGPLSSAGDHLEELERDLGDAARYVPAADGAIPAERMEIFLRLRTALVLACAEYGPVQRAFDTVDSLDTRSDAGWDDVGEVTWVLGGAALEITPFVARYFEMRNAALRAARMGLEEYAYIYALSYRQRLLAENTRRQIFCDGVPVSTEASALLVACLGRQLDRPGAARGVLRHEIESMRFDASRLPWQDGLPGPVAASLAAWRQQLDATFCPATAGLEMEVTPDRAIRLALE